MKITAETADQLSAIDHNYTQLIVSPIMVVIGLALVALAIASHKAVVLIFAAVFIILGVVLLLTRKTRTLTISKSGGSLTLVTKGITGGGTYTCQLQNIVKLQLVSEYRTQYTNNAGSGRGGISFGTGGVGMGGNTNTEQITHLNVLQRDGTSMNIADGSRSMGTTSIISKVPNQEVGERIAQFVGVPFEVVGPNVPTLGSVVAGVEQMMHHNDTAPSVAPVTPPMQTPAAPAAPAQPTPPPPNNAGPDAPGFAMPHNLPGETTEPPDPTNPPPAA